MSLLDRGKELLVVRPMVKTKNEYGTWDLVPGPPVSVMAAVQPVTVEEVEAIGTTADTTKRVIGRGPWPGGLHSVIEWDGREWDQKGENRDYRMSPRTAHFDIIMVARSAEVK